MVKELTNTRNGKSPVSMSPPVQGMLANCDIFDPQSKIQNLKSLKPMFDIFKLLYCRSLSSGLNRGLTCTARSINKNYNADYRSESVFRS